MTIKLLLSYSEATTKASKKKIKSTIKNLIFPKTITASNDKDQ